MNCLILLRDLLAEHPNYPIGGGYGQCGICLEDYTLDDAWVHVSDIARKIPGHAFHQKCWEQCRSGKPHLQCPMDRAPVKFPGELERVPTLDERYPPSRSPHLRYRLGLKVSAIPGVLGIVAGISAACLFLAGMMVTGGVLAGIAIVLLGISLAMGLRIYQVYKHDSHLNWQGVREWNARLARDAQEGQLLRAGA